MSFYSPCLVRNFPHRFFSWQPKDKFPLVASGLLNDRSNNTGGVTSDNNWRSYDQITLCYRSVSKPRRYYCQFRCLCMECYPIMRRIATRKATKGSTEWIGVWPEQPIIGADEKDSCQKARQKKKCNSRSLIYGSNIDIN